MCWEYEFAIWNGWLTIDLADLTLEPRDGSLALSTGATITVARSWDPMYIYGYGEAGFNDVGVSLDVDTTCEAYTDPFEVSLGASVYLDVVNGPDGRRLEATIPHLDWSHGISGNDLHLSGCFLGDPQGAHDMNVEVTRLGVDMYAELDYRQARMLRTDVGTEVGVDFSFDDQTGDLLLDIAFDPGQIDAAIAYDEITPEHDAEIEASFGAVFDSLMGPLLGGFLEDVTFPLPSVQGFGVSSLEYAPAGAQGTFFGLYGTVGQVSYDNGGGCGESAACEGGCATGGPSRALVALFPALVALLRRRRPTER